MIGPARALGVLMLVIATAAAACGGSSASAPTVAEAQTYLAQLVSLAQQGDFERLCASATDGDCVSDLDTAGRDAVPADPPRVIASRTIPSADAGNGMHSVGGTVLTLCGLDGRQQPYRSEMLVFRNGSSFGAINPVYWDRTGIVDGAQPVTPAAPPSGAAGC